MVSVYIKNNALSKYVTSSNEKYVVLGTRGMIYHDEDYDNCIINRNEVVEELSRIYKNSNHEKIISKHPVDPSGKTTCPSILNNNLANFSICL